MTTIHLAPCTNEQKSTHLSNTPAVGTLPFTVTTDALSAAKYEERDREFCLRFVTQLREGSEDSD